MALGRRMRTEHAGGKNGRGHWGPRVDAKAYSNKARRLRGKAEVDQAQAELPRPSNYWKGRTKF